MVPAPGCKKYVMVTWLPGLHGCDLQYGLADVAVAVVLGGSGQATDTCCGICGLFT